MSQFICYPHLCLFTYSLRQGLSYGSENLQRQDLETNHQKFWQKLFDIPIVSLDQEEELGYRALAYLLKLNSSRRYSAFCDNLMIDATVKDEPQSITVGGYYLPVRLGDSYGLLFICAEKSGAKSNKPLGYFRNLKNDLKRSVEAAKNSSIGNTWVLSGYLPEDSSPENTSEEELEKSAEVMAKEAFEKFTGQKCPYLEKGRFLGGWLFERWQPPTHWRNLEEENNHVFILIFPTLELMEKISRYYDDLLLLFYYRNKVLWAYSNYHKLKSEFPSSLPELTEIDLQSLRRSLRESYEPLWKCTQLLSSLEIQLRTIEANAKHYNAQLEKIKTNAANERLDYVLSAKSDLEFLRKFYDLTQNYQDQIRNELAIERSSLTIRRQFIDTVKGLVEIEQTEVEKRSQEENEKFQNKIQVLGVSLAVASISVAAITPFLQEKVPFGLNPFTGTLCLLLLGATFGLLGRWATQKTISGASRNNRSKVGRRKD